MSPSSLNLFRTRLEIQRCIPSKWKRTATKLEERETSGYVSGFSYMSDESMVDYLVASVRESARRGDICEGFRTYAQLQHHLLSCGGVSCEGVVHAISSLFSACTGFKALRQGQQLHANVICAGLGRHPIFVPKLVTFYSKFDLLSSAHLVTETSNILHPLPWNLLISGYVRNGMCDKAVSVYRQMAKRGIRPDNFTFPSVLKACGDLADLDFGREVHRAIYSSGLEWSLYVHNALVAMYGRCGEVSASREVFDQMVERDAVSWNSMISCYASKGMWQEVFQLFEDMKLSSVEIQIETWNIVAGGCSRLGNFKGALELICQVRNSGLCLDSMAILTGLGACSHLGVINSGKELHGYAIRGYCDMLDNVRNSLITMYARCKDIRHAYILFQSGEVKSVITWNSMLSGYTHLDMSEDASLLFRRMLLSGIEPNYVTIASILPLCARVANLQHGKEFHCYIVRKEKFKDYLLLWNSLVDMYARSGKLNAAKRLFDSLTTKDEVTYTSLIAGYGMHGEGLTALDLFEEMEKQYIKVDHITMVAVLSACSHAGLVKKGQFLFEKMQTVYGIAPRPEHFDCMIDMYGRAGLLSKARDIIISMPFKPSAAMWATLLGACRIHGNMWIGEWAAENLLEMRPQNSGYYVLIANMYAASGNWDKLAEVRVLMRDLGVKKDAGCTWVDVGSGFSSFSAGDTSNSQSDEIYPLLDGLANVMKHVHYAASERSSSDDEMSERIMNCNI
uniref:Pentatricopeptide repeat-containing protein n=1 Tax=Kalanchoe fedtschenkoi TaxID=63787 RepID=A0A7N0T4W2_KALFE